MVEIIETLNACSGPRTFFYCIIGLCALGVVTTGIVGIFQSLTRRRSKCNNCTCKK
jgi:hypothetical protein